MSLFDFNMIMEELCYEYDDGSIESGYPLEECGWIHLEESIMDDSMKVMESMYVVGAEQIQYGTVTENAIKGAFSKIGAFFKAIFEKIRSFFSWIKGLFKKKNEDSKKRTEEVVRNSREIKEIAEGKKDIKKASSPEIANKANRLKSIAKQGDGNDKKDSKKETNTDKKPEVSIKDAVTKIIVKQCKYIKDIEGKNLVIDISSMKYNFKKMADDKVIHKAQSIHFTILELCRELDNIVSKLIHADNKEKVEMLENILKNKIEDVEKKYISIFGGKSKTISEANADIEKNMKELYGTNESSREKIASGDIINFGLQGKGYIPDTSIFSLEIKSDAIDKVLKKMSGESNTFWVEDGKNRVATINKGLNTVKELILGHMKLTNIISQAAMEMKKLNDAVVNESEFIIAFLL